MTERGPIISYDYGYLFSWLCVTLGSNKLLGSYCDYKLI